MEKVLLGMQGRKVFHCSNPSHVRVSVEGFGVVRCAMQGRRHGGLGSLVLSFCAGSASVISDAVVEAEVVVGQVHYSHAYYDEDDFYNNIYDGAAYTQLRSRCSPRTSQKSAPCRSRPDQQDMCPP
jgi:hypothetical protein